jgi:hypothetical protein
MYSLKNSLHATPRAFCAKPPLPISSPTFARFLRAKSSDDDQRPPEGHALDRKNQPKNMLDPQAQNVEGSTGAPKDERPAYVHSRANKGGVTGGTTNRGKEQEAAAPSWWASLKQKVGLGASSAETKHGSQNGNI